MDRPPGNNAHGSLARRPPVGWWSVDKGEFEAEGDRLVAAANAEGIALRLLGALAFAKRCPQHAYLQETLNLLYTDIDFAAYGRDVKRVRVLLAR